MKRNAWLAYSRPSPVGRLRLFCVPYAGAGASVYRPWITALAPDVEVCAVQLPGRETRLREPPFLDLESLVPALAEGLRLHLDRPFALFGHSMGALIVFELSRILRRTGGAGPAHLFVSGCRAPQVPPREERHRSSDEDLREELRRLGGTPDEVLGDDEFVQWYLPTLRADFAVCDSYGYREEEPLDCPITAFHGRSDPDVSREDTEKWKAHTTAAFSLLSFEGGHLFVQTQQGRVLTAVSESLVPLARTRP